MLDFYERKGYAPQQAELDVENLIVGGQEDRLDTIFQNRNLQEDNLRHFLNWILKTYDPQLAYYPFCGWHITPREVFGNRLVSLSLDDCHPHLVDIGEGLRVQANIAHQPFNDNTFDAVVLRPGRLKSMDFSSVFANLRRVVKEDGFFVATTDQTKKYCKKYLQKVDVPDDIARAMAGCHFGLYLNRDLPSKRGFWFWRG